MSLQCGRPPRFRLLTHGESSFFIACNVPLLGADCNLDWNGCRKAESCPARLSCPAFLFHHLRRALLLQVPEYNLELNFSEEQDGAPNHCVN